MLHAQDPILANEKEVCESNVRPKSSDLETLEIPVARTLPGCYQPGSEKPSRKRFDLLDHYKWRR